MGKNRAVVRLGKTQFNGRNASLCNGESRAYFILSAFGAFYIVVLRRKVFYRHGVQSHGRRRRVGSDDVDVALVHHAFVFTVYKSDVFDCGQNEFVTVNRFKIAQGCGELFLFHAHRHLSCDGLLALVSLAGSDCVNLVGISAGVFAVYCKGLSACDALTVFSPIERVAYAVNFDVVFNRESGAFAVGVRGVSRHDGRCGSFELPGCQIRCVFDESRVFRKRIACLVNPFVKNESVFFGGVHARNRRAERTDVFRNGGCAVHKSDGVARVAYLRIDVQIAFDVVEGLEPTFKGFARLQKIVDFFLRRGGCALAVFHGLLLRKLVADVEVHGKGLHFPLSVQNASVFELVFVKRLIAVFVERPSHKIVSFAHGGDIGDVGRVHDLCHHAAFVLRVETDCDEAEGFLPGGFVASAKRSDCHDKQCYHARKRKMFFDKLPFHILIFGVRMRGSAQATLFRVILST